MASSYLAQCFTISFLWQFMLFFWGYCLPFIWIPVLSKTKFKSNFTICVRRVANCERAPQPFLLCQPPLPVLLNRHGNILQSVILWSWSSSSTAKAKFQWENIYRTLNISQKLVESYIAIGISLLPEIYLLLCYVPELFPANIKSVIDFYCWMFCSCWEGPLSRLLLLHSDLLQ